MPMLGSRNVGYGGKSRHLSPWGVSSPYRWPDLKYNSHTQNIDSETICRCIGGETGESETNKAISSCFNEDKRCKVVGCVEIKKSDRYRCHAPVTLSLFPRELPTPYWGRHRMCFFFF